ncbi:HAD hydrolase-like protein [Micromonospora sp. WMMB482]|uniref:HAD hydrolase-like protein n=1 Tax=Micromonospora sp. WMMB482 TaxID=2849653 RepID=UPI0027E0955D|nr:HAD hydrolase-like protein [Micromonospora sp. WMMB482]
MDADGLTNRWDLADAIRDRYALRIPSIDLGRRAARRRGGPHAAGPAGGMRAADRVPTPAGAGGGHNGASRQQDAKIRKTGLDRYVADWVISEEGASASPTEDLRARRPAGPDAAARRVVVGDSPEADIGGATAVGLPSVWLHRGRRWSDPRFAPTRIEDGLIAAVAAVLAADRCRRRAGRRRGKIR